MTILEAQRELESALLTMGEHYKVAWTKKGFRALYFLVHLAKKGKKAGK